MPSSVCDIRIFVDYDNLLPRQKVAGILDVVTKAIFLLPWDPSKTRANCEVRIYGGWFEGALMTRRAQDVAVEIQRDFPKIIRRPIPNAEVVPIVVNAELAVALLQEPGHHLFHTYRRKGAPRNIYVEEPTTIGCSDAACILPIMKKLIKTGACPQASCSVKGELIYRDEQKIVDTMLCCDLIYSASQKTDRIVLVSGDDDFLPPLRTIQLGGTPAVRIHPKPTNKRATFPTGGAQLLEMDL